MEWYGEFYRRLIFQFASYNSIVVYEEIRSRGASKKIWKTFADVYVSGKKIVASLTSQ